MVRVVTLAFWVLKLSCLSGLVISGPTRVTRGQDWMSVGCVGTGAIFLKIAHIGGSFARAVSADNAKRTGDAGRLVSACRKEARRREPLCLEIIQSKRLFL